MQFTSVQDINAPIEHVFDQISDFDSYEAYAMRVGASVERLDQLTHKAAGMCWNFKGNLRGKERDINIELVEYSPSKQLAFNCSASGIDAEIEIEAMVLTKKQTRLKVKIDLKPRSISARLIMQSAKLAKNSLNRKFNHRVWTFANHVEDSYRR